MKIEFDTSKMVKEIVMQVEENQEEFIFKTIQPYCEDVLQMKINKEKLKQILLNSVQKQEPKTIQEKQAESKKYQKAFDDGYENGYAQAKFDHEPQPKGKWIERWCEWQQYIECSECGYETGLRCNTNFCPNCGAKMEESEDRE